MDLSGLFGNVDTNQLLDVVEVVAKNKDVLARLGELPDFIAKLADSMSGAGGEAKSAALALVGTDGNSGARGALGGASHALSEIAASMSKGAGMISAAADAAHKVPLMDGPADHLGEAAATLNSSTAALGELATSLASIAQVLVTVSHALDKVGDHLVDTSTEARGFLATPAN